MYTLLILFLQHTDIQYSKYRMLYTVYIYIQYSIYTVDIDILYIYIYNLEYIFT